MEDTHLDGNQDDKDVHILSSLSMGKCIQEASYHKAKEVPRLSFHIHMILARLLALGTVFCRRNYKIIIIIKNGKYLVAYAKMAEELTVMFPTWQRFLTDFQAKMNIL